MCDEYVNTFFENRRSDLYPEKVSSICLMAYCVDYRSIDGLTLVDWQNSRSPDSAVASNPWGMVRYGFA